jgi:enoyl-CoA hydratase/carnithine racemase
MSIRRKERFADMEYTHSDISVASPTASFGLPEATVGVYAYGGGLPRLVRTVGLHAASDIALTGRRVSAQEAFDLRIVSRIAKTPESVLDETLEVAKQIANISPDGIVVTRAALREAWETASVERAFQLVHDRYYEDLMKSQNSREGLAAFREKRKAKWREAKL